MEYLREIILAIERYRADIINYPIYFSMKNLNYLNSEESIKNISEKLRDIEYKPRIPEIYFVPYDVVSNRIAYDRDIDDLIIRYIVMGRIQKAVELYENQINPELFGVCCVVDIYDCYNSIDKEMFVNLIKDSYSDKIDNKTVKLLRQTVCFEGLGNRDLAPISVGSKPDEYYAELFLSAVHLEINNIVSEDISRNGDEFLICADSVNDLRRVVFNVDEILAGYGLKINKSKNNIKFQSERRQVTRVIPYEEPWPYSTPSCPPPTDPTILYKEVMYTKTLKKISSMLKLVM